jgi:hypothetical protein
MSEEQMRRKLHQTILLYANINSSQKWVFSELELQAIFRIPFP